MRSIRFYLPRVNILSLISLCCLFLLAACGSGGSAPQIQETTQAVTETELPTAQPTTVISSRASTPDLATTPDVAFTPEAEATQIDACSLLNKADVEAAVGRAVLDPKAEQVANLACCSYGDPETPVISVATVCAFVGSDSEYFAGATAQAQEVFTLGKNNAASAQPVSGLGDDAYWDETFGDLNVLQGRYVISLEISLDTEDDAATLAVARGLAEKMLQRLE